MHVNRAGIKLLLTTGVLFTLSLGAVTSCGRPSGRKVWVEFPPEVPFNSGAGAGKDFLCVTVRLEDGQELLLAVESGQQFTSLDKSLEPKLGKSIGLRAVGNAWLGKRTFQEFPAPHLYFGNTRLVIGDYVCTEDISERRVSPPVMGLLGLDFLRCYCMQIDFESRRIRFLNSKQLKTEDLGKAFPIDFARYGLPAVRGDFFGETNATFIIDTGNPLDGALQLPEFAALRQKQPPEDLAESPIAGGGVPHWALFQGGWGISSNDHQYLCYLGESQDANQLGLRFLSRYLVTLDFPGETMYLRPRALSPALAAAEAFMAQLSQTNALPGWVPGDHGGLRILNTPGIDSQSYPVTNTFVGVKEGDPYRYVYTVVQASSNSPCTLQRAWRSDTNQKLIEEYRLP